MKNIKFAIIGFGHIGKRHATIANEFEGAQVVAVVDINLESTKHELFPHRASYFASIEELIAAKVVRSYSDREGSVEALKTFDQITV